MARTTSTLGRCKDDIHRRRADQLSHLLARRRDYREKKGKRCQKGKKAKRKGKKFSGTFSSVATFGPLS
jgi:hypothetical protein